MEHFFSGTHFFTLVLITTKHETWIGLFDFSDSIIPISCLALFPPSLATGISLTMSAIERQYQAPGGRSA